MSVEDGMVEKLFRLLGTEDLEEAIKNIEREREGMRQLHDENTALRIYNHKIRLVVDYAMRVFAELESTVGLFLPEKVRKMIGESRNQIAQADRALIESRALSERKF